MECVEAKALKSSLWAEMLAFRPSAQDQYSNEDDDYCGASSVVSGGEELLVDGFLDLSNEDVAGGSVEEGNDDEEEEEDGEEEEEEEKARSVYCSTADENSSSSVGNLAKDEFGAGIDLPTDDLAALEWLSHFVEDSFTEFPIIPYTAPKPSPSPPTLARLQVPAKARSKRNRAGARVWSLHAPQPTESSTSSSSSTVTESHHDDSQRPPSKKRKPAAAPVKDRKSEPARRCSHCLVQKTPQWRTGPMGAKTLCNACGVRYKSGRLLPEYRPAGSPTFVSHVHSNSHKKVLEMRRRKEDRFEAGSAPSAVESF